MKYIKFKRLNFSIFAKYIDNLRYYFFKVLNFIGELIIFNIKRIFKHLTLPKYQLPNIPKINVWNFYKNINLSKYKSAKFYIFYFIFFVTFSYVSIPFFYNYDKAEIEKTICKNKKNIECLIQGKVKYNFFPSPRVNIDDLIIKISTQKKKRTLAKVEETFIKLSFFDLLNKNKKKFKKIVFKNFEIIFDLNNYKNYLSIFEDNKNLIPITFEGGQILFFDKKDFVASIENTFLKLNSKKDLVKTELKGDFLDDSIFIDSKIKIKDNKTSNDLIVKISKFNLLLKSNIYYMDNNKETIKGNFLIKKDKNRITSIFSYSENILNLTKTKVANTLMEGNAEGKIAFSPYFNFDIDLSLNNLNFTKLYNLFLFLDDEDKKRVFNVNRKMNGILNISSDKIYSNNNLVTSFESRLKFNNRNIIVEQFILNLGKLGAADIIGKLDKSKKSNNFKFEKNIYVDNQKKFLSKFGIYNKKKIATTMFVSGSFDLDKPNMHFYEMFYEEKISNEDVNYIEKEFNNLMLEDNYKTLFNFLQFKEFVKSINRE